KVIGALPERLQTLSFGASYSEAMQPKWSNVLLGDQEDPRRRLEELFGEPTTSGLPQQVARQWAVDVLERGGVDPRRQQILAIRLLRKAEPRLTLKTAVYLARNVSLG